LEQRHAERLAEHLPEFVRRAVLGRRRRIGGLLQPGAPPQVGVHHVALDRSRPDDGDLHHEVVEARRAQPGQHRHLRPALDLEHAQAVGPAQHGVGLGAVARNAREVEAEPGVAAQQAEGPAQAGQHAEREDIDLQDAERVQVVLVPLQHRAAVHGGVAHHREFDQRPAGDDEAAHVGGEVAGEPLEVFGKSERH